MNSNFDVPDEVMSGFLLNCEPDYSRFTFNNKELKMKNAVCPICNKDLHYLSRYNNLVCGDCAATAVDTLNVPVTFYNEDLSGGLQAVHKNRNGETTDRDFTCFINGHQCTAIELRFGGTAIQFIK